MAPISQQATAKNKAPTILGWLTLIFLSVIWGSSYILIKKGLAVYSPLQVACLRLGITALIFTPLLFTQRVYRYLSRWRLLFYVGLIGSLLPAFLFPAAQTKISSGAAGILSSLTPLLTFLVGIAAFHQKTTNAKIIGVILGLGGASYLMYLENTVGFQGFQFGFLIVIACLGYALSTNIIKKSLSGIPSLAISAISFALIGWVAIMVLFTFTDFIWVVKNQPGAYNALGYVATLALSSTALASIIYFKLIKETSALFAASVSYLTPVVAIAWGLFDGEAISLKHFTGLGMILLGIYLSKD